MRLIDQIVHADAVVEARDRAGIVHRLAGVGSKAEAIKRCALRYVVELEASQQCFDLLMTDNGLLVPENDFLRVPAEELWVEWIANPATPTTAEHRMGTLVEADASGRQGTITTFWLNRNGEADLSIAAIDFDLDCEFKPISGPLMTRRLRHQDLPHLDALFKHTLFRVDSAWADYIRANDPAGHDSELGNLASMIWANLPFVLCLSTLMNSTTIFEQHRSDIARLNLARVKRGRRPLLDHIEVRMALDSRHAPGPGTASAGRVGARLHHVRGHLVKRGGKTFWRSPHLRGDPTTPVARKTITVTGLGPIAARGSQDTAKNRDIGKWL